MLFSCVETDLRQDPVLYRGYIDVPCSYGKLYVGRTRRLVSTITKKYFVTLDKNRAAENSILVEHFRTTDNITDKVSVFKSCNRLIDAGTG